MNLDASAHRHWHRGNAFVQCGDWTRAAQSFEAGERIVPRAALFPLHPARALLHPGRASEALDAARRAHRLDADEPLALWTEAHALERLQRHDEVVALLLALPPERPRDHEMRSLLASALLRCGRHRDAIPAYLDALALKLDDAPMRSRASGCASATCRRTSTTTRRCT
jgi:tetratricopeptide (TPR) repeat protein